MEHKIIIHTDSPDELSAYLTSLAAEGWTIRVKSIRRAEHGYTVMAHAYRKA